MSDSTERSSVVEATLALRDTTKWIFVAGATLIAALIGGLNVGQLSNYDSNATEFKGALAAITAGVGLLCFVLHAATRVLTRKYATLRDVLRAIEFDPQGGMAKALRTSFDQESDYLFGTEARDVNHLWHQIRERNRHAREHGDSTASVDLRLNVAERRVVEFTDFFVTKWRFRRLLIRVALALPILIALGTLLENLSPEAEHETLTVRLEPISIAILDEPLASSLARRANCSAPPFEHATLLGVFADTSDLQIGLPGLKNCKPVSFRAQAGQLQIEGRT